MEAISFSETAVGRFLNNCPDRLSLLLRWWTLHSTYDYQSTRHHMPEDTVTNWCHTTALRLQNTSPPHAPRPTPFFIITAYAGSVWRLNTFSEFYVSLPLFCVCVCVCVCARACVCWQCPKCKATTEEKGKEPHFFQNRIIHFKRIDVAPTLKTRSCCTNFKTNNAVPKLEPESKHGVKACSTRTHRSQKLRKANRVASCGGGSAWCANVAVKQSLTLSTDDPGSTGIAADRRPLTLEKREGNSLVSRVGNTRSTKGAPCIWVFWALEYKHLLWKT